MKLLHSGMNLSRKKRLLSILQAMLVAWSVNIPNILKILPGYDITSFVEEICIMESVVSIVGLKRIGCLLADRGFGNGNFIEGLLKVRELPIPMMNNRQVKKMSMFRYVYINLLHDFWANVKNTSVMPT